ncbi:MAG TPA: NPCBM/NEW2 domain-containing protein, partial [Planctomycetaceae bacterium]|nr:NPCBM/NEW2 domain-containing protein [Planctomycetaceae bacterium]
MLTSNTGVAQDFSLNRLMSHKPGPWSPDQFNYDGSLIAGGTYEAVISTDGNFAQTIGYIALPPMNLSASDGAYTDKVQVTWSASLGATSYEVWRKTGNSFASVTRVADNVGSPTYDDTSAIAGTTYTYWVRAKSLAGTSGFSNSDAGYRAIPSTAKSVYASDLFFDPNSPNGWGLIERDRSNGETGPADGHTLTLDGVTYAKGLGAHSYSNVQLNLDGRYAR